MRPPAQACGPAHTLLFSCTLHFPLDWSRLSYPNFILTLTYRNLPAVKGRRERYIDNCRVAGLALPRKGTGAPLLSAPLRGTIISSYPVIYYRATYTRGVRGIRSTARAGEQVAPTAESLERHGWPSQIFSISPQFPFSGFGFVGTE